MTYKTRKTASQQLTGIGFVVGLHLVGIYMVASGLAHQAVETVIGPIETKVIEEAKPKQEELPPPPPKLQTPPPYVPPPDLDVAVEAPPPAATTTAISNVSSKPAPVQAPPPSVPDSEAKLDPRNRRNQITESDYPNQSIRLKEEGSPIISVLVLEDGTVGEAKLLQSCGIERLDNAALVLVKRFRYIPAVKDGKPLAAWKAQTVVFKLTR